MKLRADLDPGYVAATQRVFQRIARLLDGIDRKLLPLRVYVAGGAAALFHTGLRPSRDIDATLSLRIHLPQDLAEPYIDRAGNPASVYLDPRYSDTLGPLHEGAFADSEPLDIDGIDGSVLEVRVLTPVDLAVSKLGRFDDNDRADIEGMARAGLLDADVFGDRAEAALDYYVGHPAAPRANLRNALKLIRANTPQSPRRRKRHAPK